MTATRHGGDADIAAVAELFAAPSRARVLLALADGRALPASVLAAEVGVSPQATSTQLKKLNDGGLITVEKSGRYRYYRLASARVAEVLEALAGVAPAQPIRSLREDTRAAALRRARTCYDHLAGRLGCAVTQALLDRGALDAADGVDDTRRRGGETLSAVVRGVGPSALVYAPTPSQAGKVIAVRPKGRLPFPWAPAADGSIAMATGIVSVALSLAGFVVLADTWLAVEITVWLALGCLIVARFLLDRPGWLSDARTPAALTAVAASTMLGSGMSDHGWRDLAWTLLALALLAWLVLTPLVLVHWRRPTIGNSFLVVVAVQGLVLLGGTLALTNDDVWLGDAATIGFLVGLLAYLWVLVSFDWTQIACGRGDHWVLTGSLAISALAGARVVIVTDPSGAVAALTNLHVAMRDVDLVVLGVCLAGYGVLAAAELRWPRWRYNVSRWATVFPLGMTAAAAMSVSTAASVGWLRPLGEVLVWPALAVWIIVAVGAARTGRGRNGVSRRS